MDNNMKLLTVTKSVDDGDGWIDEYTVYALREPNWHYYQVKDGVKEEQASAFHSATWKIDGSTLTVSNKQEALDYIELLQKVVVEYEAEEESK